MDARGGSATGGYRSQVTEDPADLRQRLSTVLDSIGDDTLQEVVAGIFGLEKLTKADCPHCGKSANVLVPDYRGFAAGLAALTDQGKGKAATAVPVAPKEASKEELMEAIGEVLSEMTQADLARIAR